MLLRRTEWTPAAARTVEFGNNEFTALATVARHNDWSVAIRREARRSAVGLEATPALGL
jgi:hypothetical protein